MDTTERIRAMTIAENATIRATMRAIEAGALGLALIADETGRFRGVVTDGDLRRALLAGLGLEAPLGSVERPPSRALPLSTPPEEIADLATEAIRCIPLLDDDARVVDLAVFDRRAHLPVAEPQLGDRELEYVTECLVTGWISSGGKFVRRFEEIFATYCGTRYAVATMNGTAALHLALVALEVGAGDEVIVPSFTFIASANVCRYVGATPVFVDSEDRSWNIDPDRIEAAITPRTRAIMPVHIYGHPADMDPILDIARRHDLAVIEDAAEAHGATYRGRRVGGIGKVGCFSFFGNKIVTTGEGGMLVTHDLAIADRVRQLRDHGMSPTRRYWHTMLGFNYRMTNVQAAIGVAQMERIDEIQARRRELARAYEQRLSGIRGVHLQPHASWAESVCWLFSITIDPGVFGMGRDDLLASLQARGIDTRPLFPPAHLQPIYDTGQSLPVSERLGATGLSLPTAAGMRMAEIDRVASAIAGPVPVTGRFGD